MTDFYEGLAEILEVDAAAIHSAFDLHGGDAAWDSLAVVSTMALLDEVFNITVDGQSLGNCATVGDIEALVQAAKNALKVALA